MDSTKDLSSAISYPLDFPIKVMGPNVAGFEAAIVSVVRRHAADFDPASLTTRASRESKYLSITVTIRAVSREQLDNLYRELSDHPMVSMVL